MWFLYIFLAFIVLILLAPSQKKEELEETPEETPEETREEAPKEILEEIPEAFASDSDRFGYHIVIDTETSSLDVDRGEVLQLSGIKVKTDTGEPIETFNAYLKPTENARIDSAAMKVNKIPLGFLKNASDRKEAFEKFNEFCSGIDFVLGYNLKFDMDMLRDDIKKEGLKFALSSRKIRKVDVLKIARKEIDSFYISNYKLSTVANFLCVAGDSNNFHNSLYDCLVTNNIWAKLSLGGRIISESYSNKIIEIAKSALPEEIDLSTLPSSDLFAGKNVCISGTFDQISRTDLEKYIVKCGGTLKTGMSSKVNIFLNGDNLLSTGKETKYSELISKGFDIKRLTEDELVAELKAAKEP